VTLAATGCFDTTKTLYTFTDVPIALPAGETNLIGNASFETPFRMCDTKCNARWNSEYTTVAVPRFYASSAGRVTGQLAETISYDGRSGDHGKTATLDRDVEIYQSVQAGRATAAGQTLTFTLWVSGHCDGCAPFPTRVPGRHSR
jgi:hypothetical protein